MSFIETMADREEAYERSRLNPEHAWVLTYRDVWHPNPFYTGPRQPHPEDDGAHEFIDAHGIEAWRSLATSHQNPQTSPEDAPADPDPWFPW